MNDLAGNNWALVAPGLLAVVVLSGIYCLFFIWKLPGMRIKLVVFKVALGAVAINVWAAAAFAVSVIFEFDALERGDHNTAEKFGTTVEVLGGIFLLSLIVWMGGAIGGWIYGWLKES